MIVYASQNWWNACLIHLIILNDLAWLRWILKRTKYFAVVLNHNDLVMKYIILDRWYEIVFIIIRYLYLQLCWNGNCYFEFKRNQIRGYCKDSYSLTEIECYDFGVFTFCWWYNHVTYLSILIVLKKDQGWFSVNISSYQFKKSHFRNKMTLSAKQDFPHW